MSTAALSTEPRDRTFFVVNAVVSLVAVAVIGWILMVREPAGDTHALAFMPAVNATMNALATAFLVAGYGAIRRKKRDLHRALMLSAFGASAIFLVGYLVYHWSHGDTRYPADAPLRLPYLAILFTHVLGSIACLPMVLATFYFALRDRVTTHRKLAKVTLPLWLYVSVTGVLVFAMLKIWNP